MIHPITQSINLPPGFRIFSTVLLLPVISVTAEQINHQNVTVAPGDKKTVGFTTENPGDTYQLDVSPSGGKKFKTTGSDNILGENSDGDLWQRVKNTEQLKRFKVASANIHEGHEALFNLEFKKEGGGGGGGGGPLADAYVKAVNCFVKIHKPGTISAPGALIPAPTQVGKPYSGMLQSNTDDEIAAGVADCASVSKIGTGLTADNDLVKVELSWNPTTLRPDMMNGKTLTLILPAGTNAYRDDGTQLTQFDVTIGSGGSDQLSQLASTRKQNIFLEADGTWNGGDVILKVGGLDNVGVLDNLGAQGKAMLAPVDIEISNGQAARDPVLESNEETIGAFTVANLNNTDGDNEVDNVDDIVKKVTAGDDEEDLMKLVIRGPGDGRAKLTVVSGSVEFWEKSTKETKLVMQGNSLYFDGAQLPKTIWVEATNYSSSVRDIQLKLGYEDSIGTLIDDLDKVKATAVWSEITSVKNNITDTLWRDADGAAIIDTHNSYKFGVNFEPPTVVPPAAIFYYAIGFEFTLKPSGVGSEPNVKFDITRQIEKRYWSRASGGAWQKAEEPWEIFDAADFSNDDTRGGDEDNMPTNDHIYSIDAPGHLNDGAFNEFVARLNFNEFARVSFGGVKPSGENSIGSRCSPKQPWHAHYWVEGNGTQYNQSAGKTNSVDTGHVLLGGTTNP